MRKDMDTLDSNAVESHASIEDAIYPILRDHLANIKTYQEAARANAISIGYRLRELLVPILNRWGIGWYKGIWTFPMVIEDPSNYLGTVTLSCNVLDLVHNNLSQLLYESDGNGNCLYNYVEPISLLQGVKYVWVLSYYRVDADELGTLVVEGTIPLSLTAVVPPLPIAGQHYHGPITQEFYDDVVSTGGSVIELVQNIPTYKAGPNGTWMLDRDWDEGYHYSGMWGSDGYDYCYLYQK